MAVEDRGDTISATVTGGVSGQVAVGKSITQHQVTHTALTGGEVEELHAVFARAKVEVAAAAPPDQRDAALSRVEELEEAVTGDEPDIATIEYVKRWFTRKLPSVAGLLAGVFVHPLVGKVIEAAGRAAIEDAG